MGERFRIDPDDERGFDAARDALTDRFELWLAEAGVEDDGLEVIVDHARLALEWKWGYGDGDLGRWRTTDVYEFLVEWCPRKLSVEPAESVAIPRALVALTAFLHTEGLLASGSSSADDLVEAVAQLTDEFVSAMGDTSRFGLAKSLFAAASAEGVDLTDPEQMDEWISEFNARPEEERRQVIPDPAFGRPTSRTLPPVALPHPAEVEASRAEAPIVAVFARMAGFVGGGRKLTQTGNLTLADARELVDLLGTGDRMDEQIGDETFKTKSSADLLGLRQIFAWAKKAGVLRVAHGRVIATKQGLGLAEGAAAGFFDRTLDALLAIGPLASQRHSDGWFAWPEVNEMLDEVALTLLAGPYVTQRPLPIEDLADVATDLVLDTFEFGALDDDRVAGRVAADLVDMMSAFELAGVVRRLDLPDPTEAEREMTPRRHGGTVELTPAGVAATHRLLVEAGYEAPTVGRFTEATATELFLGTDLDDFPTLLGEIELWRRRRDPAQAAAELAKAASEMDDPALQNLALAVLSEIDADVAGPELRRLAAEPATRGFALCWLVDQGLEDARELFDPDDVDSFVDVLAHRFVFGGAEAVVDTLALVGGDDAQIGVIGQLWRSPSMATDRVLSIIGGEHPAKKVAKAANKARFQRRSWLHTQ